MFTNLHKSNHHNYLHKPTPSTFTYGGVGDLTGQAQLRLNKGAFASWPALNFGGTFTLQGGVMD